VSGGALLVPRFEELPNMILFFGMGDWILEEI
jgi:hypothetical protein